MNNEIIIKNPRSSRNLLISISLIVIFYSLLIFTCWFSYFFITHFQRGTGDFGKGLLFASVGLPCLALISVISSIKRLFGKKRYFKFNNHTVSFCVDTKRAGMQFDFYESGFWGYFNRLYDKLSDNEIYTKEIKYKNIENVIFEKENILFELKNNYKIKISLKDIDISTIENLRTIIIEEGFVKINGIN